MDDAEREGEKGDDGYYQKTKDSWQMKTDAFNRIAALLELRTLIPSMAEKHNNDNKLETHS